MGGEPRHLTSGASDLEQLAALAVSWRRVLVGSVLVLTVVFVAGVSLARVSAEALETWQVLLIGGVLLVATLAMRFVMRLPTPPAAFPSIRVLMERPDQVAFIVLIDRGTPFLALTDAHGSLLAKPLRLKGATVLGEASADIEASQLTTAASIASRHCPQAQTRRISDTTGLSSLARLARKAVRS